MKRRFFPFSLFFSLDLFLYINLSFELFELRFVLLLLFLLFFLHTFFLPPSSPLFPPCTFVLENGSRWNVGTTWYPRYPRVTHTVVFAVSLTQGSVLSRSCSAVVSALLRASSHVVWSRIRILGTSIYCIYLSYWYMRLFLSLPIDANA